MHVITNFKLIRIKILNLNTTLQNQFIDKLEKELSLPNFVDLMVNNTISKCYFGNDERQIIFLFNDNAGEFITSYCISL